MATVVKESMRMCSKCRHQTLHCRNDKKINWAMHIVLTIVTAGLWSFVLVYAIVWHILTMKIGGKWTCTACGTEN